MQRQMKMAAFRDGQLERAAALKHVGVRDMVDALEQTIAGIVKLKHQGAVIVARQAAVSAKVIEMTKLADTKLQELVRLSARN